MIEQAVAKLDTRPEKRRKRIYRIAQIVLGVVLLTGWVLGFTLISVLWDGDRAAFWAGFVQLLLLGTPVLALLGILEVLAGRLGVEYDYELVGGQFCVYRIARNRRRLCCRFEAEDVTFCKRYSRIGDGEAHKLQRALILCCNSDSPSLTVVEVRDCLTGRRRGPRVLLLEMGEKLEQALRPTLRRNGL